MSNKFFTIIAIVMFSMSATAADSSVTIYEKEAAVLCDMSGVEYSKGDSEMNVVFCNNGHKHMRIGPIDPAWKNINSSDGIDGFQWNNNSSQYAGLEQAYDELQAKLAAKQEKAVAMSRYEGPKQMFNTFDGKAYYVEIDGKKGIIEGELPAKVLKRATFVVDLVSHEAIKGMTGVKFDREEINEWASSGHLKI